MNHWDKLFQSTEYMYGTEANVFLKDSYEKLNLTGNLLAIAEGEGRNAVYLSEKGLNVTVWDYAQSGLDKANKLAQEMGVTVNTELVDLQEANWETEKWDAIINIFGHFPKEIRNKTMTHIKNAVKPGGFFITEVYSVDQLSYNSGGPKNVDMLYNLEEFLDTFSDWKVIHCFLGEVTRHEGKQHNGLSHVIQFIGQKPM